MRIFLVILMGIFVVTGCSKTNQNPNTNMQQSVSNQQITAYPQQTAIHLEKLATSFPQVQSAHVVMLGNVAVVGINVKANLPRSQVDNLKYSVSEALHKDPNGAHAVVTADMDLDQRLENIRQAVMEGRPIGGFTNELGIIVGRIIPQLPKEAVPKSSIAPTGK
jgi:YhcN/YlaJ family sporulation lipoprotein